MSKKNKMGKKQVQNIMDDAGAMLQAGHPFIVANALRKACKKVKIPLFFGLTIKKKEYDATLFLNNEMVHVSLGTRKRKVAGTRHLKYEDDVQDFLTQVLDSRVE